MGTEHKSCYARRVARHRGAHHFARVRQHACSKICAALFILLILIPFTAPFPTFHLKRSSHSHPYDALPKDLKEKTAADYKVAISSAESVVIRPATHTALHELVQSSRRPQRPSLRTVLRI